MGEDEEEVASPRLSTNRPECKKLAAASVGTGDSDWKH